MTVQPRRPAVPGRARCRRLICGLAVAVVSAVSLAACGGTAGAGGAPIRIGVPLPLSGASASAGQDMLAAARLAAADVNAAGGVNGRTVQIIEVDDACSPQQGALAAQRLVNSGVVAVAGGYCSSASVPQAPIFGRAGIPFVLAASTNPVLTRNGNGKVFRTCGRDDRQALFAARFVTEQLGLRRIALLHDNSTYSKGLADATAEALRHISGAQVVYLDALQPGQSDYTPVLTRIASTKPDVLYFTGYLAEAGLLLRQRQQLGLGFTFLGGDSTTDATVLRTAGATAEGFLATTEPLPGGLPSARDFVHRFRDRNGVDPGPFSVYEYDAVRVVASAIAAARSTDGGRITTALHAVTDYQGVTGRIGFDAGGDRTGLVYISVIVRNGGFVGYRKLDDAGRWVDALSA